MNKIISYSLWGNEPFYTVGAIQNAKQNPEIFGNEWTSRFYIHKDVSSDIIDQINAYENVEIFIVNENPDLTPYEWIMTMFDELKGSGVTIDDIVQNGILQGIIIENNV